jgi:hypothetical protein
VSRSILDTDYTGPSRLVAIDLGLDSTTRMCYDYGDLAKPNLESVMLDLALPGHMALATNMRCVSPPIS